MTRDCVNERSGGGDGGRGTCYTCEGTERIAGDRASNQRGGSYGGGGGGGGRGYYNYGEIGHVARSCPSNQKNGTALQSVREVTAATRCLGTSKYDLTEKSCNYLHEHLIMPLLEYVYVKSVYNGVSLVKTKLEVLQGTSATDYATDTSQGILGNANPGGGTDSGHGREVGTS
ncbi:hypothetical protein D915_011104 [Fasciola hepatica]|uniref:Eukaryotic translation initiation factor 3 subunit E N-terminal domain-containing protein n=1 Tax=Fasciola hepatica TaxID=6192 RepID=A0A4E0RUN9_FASHE|nr:hypothetical protein D915_011104 [Fasciola hepatica]